jgi:hypothetical protein
MKPFNVINLFDDPTGNGGINLRYLKRMMEIAGLTDLKHEELEPLLNVMLLIAKKLAAVWNHFERYTTVQKRLIDEANFRPTSASNSKSVIHKTYS